MSDLLDIGQRECGLRTVIERAQEQRRLRADGFQSRIMLCVQKFALKAINNTQNINIFTFCVNLFAYWAIY